MLNLKELERKLDEALASETPESLTTWLLGLRATADTGYSVEEIDLAMLQEQFMPQRSGQAKFNLPVEEPIGLYDYAMAA